MTTTKKTKTRNKFELKLYNFLRAQPNTFSYETEKIPYVLAGHYIPDYIVDTPTGKVYIEAKGHFRPEAKRKMVAVKKQHPELDLRMVFYSYNKTNISWAIRHGFKYAIKDIPSEWLQGL